MRAFPPERPPFSRRAALALLGLAWGAGLRRGVPAASAGEAPEFQLIVHPSNALRAAPRELLADAFLKKFTRWQDGVLIRPVDLRPDNTVRRRFSEIILKRSVGAVRSYWQQRIFAGRDVPPPELDSDASVIEFVAKAPGGLGYVSRGVKLVGVVGLDVQ
jgi:hypothetical protein